jgi:hypothetical protein
MRFRKGLQTARCAGCRQRASPRDQRAFTQCIVPPPSHQQASVSGALSSQHPNAQAPKGAETRLQDTEQICLPPLHSGVAL